MTKMSILSKRLRIEEEIEAVIAHEIGHIKHWDVAVITVASMLPLMVYYTIIFFGSFL